MKADQQTGRDLKTGQKDRQTDNTADGRDRQEAVAAKGMWGRAVALRC